VSAKSDNQGLLISDLPGNHIHPTFVTLADGSQWLSWLGGGEKRDRIYVRGVKGNRFLTDPIRLSDYNVQSNYMPCMVTDGKNTAWVIWTEIVDLKSRIMARCISDGTVGELTAITSAGEKAQEPAAMWLNKKSLWVAWEKRTSGAHQIWARNLLSRNSEPVRISQTKGDSHRACWTKTADGTAWLFWDTYSNKNYNIMCRPLKNGRWGREMCVSSSAEWESFPYAVALSDGRLMCGWTRSKDVINDEGIVGHHTQFCAAVHDGEAWTCVGDIGRGADKGVVDIGVIFADRAHRKDYCRAYFGRMRHIRLIADDKGGAWMCWEQSQDFRSMHFRNASLLCGRHFRKGRWSAPQVIESHVPFFHFEPGAISSRNSVWIVHEDPCEGDFSDVRLRKVRLAHSRARVPASTMGKPRQWKTLDGSAVPVLSPHRDKFRAKGHKVFFGDMHVHGHFSKDNQGELDELFHTARDRSHLDFMAVANHDELRCDPIWGSTSSPGHEPVLGGLTQQTFSEYDLTQFASDTFNAPGDFAFLGGSYEYTREWAVTGYNTVGSMAHFVVVYPTTGAPMFRSYDRHSDTSAKLAAAVDKFGGMLHGHHENWFAGGQQAIYNVEVAGWANYVENNGRIHKYLSQGLRMGFIAGGDDHGYTAGRIGALTAVLAKDLSRESVVDALKKRRCYATNGPRILIDFRVNGHLMGENIRCRKGPLKITFDVGTTAPLRRVELRLDGETVRTWRAGGDHLKRSCRIKWPGPGHHFIYLRVVQEGPEHKSTFGNQAWTSPVFINWPAKCVIIE